MDRFLSLDLASRRQRQRATRRRAADPWRAHPADAGSPAVQILQWTERLAQLDAHRLRLPKDTKAAHAQQRLRAQRHRMLRYLRKSNYEGYFRLITALGLPDEQPRPHGQRHAFEIDDVLDREEALVALNIMEDMRSGKPEKEKVG